MQDNDIDNILIEIVKEFTKPENFNRIMNEQVLANAIFYSFAIGALNNEEDAEDTIESLNYVIQWIEDKEHLLKGFRIASDKDE